MKVPKKLSLILTFAMKLRACAIGWNRAAPASKRATSSKFIPKAKHTERQQIREHRHVGANTFLGVRRMFAPEAALRTLKPPSRKRSHLPLRAEDGALKTDCCQSSAPLSSPLSLSLTLSLSLSLSLSPSVPPPPPNHNQQTEELELLRVSRHCKLVIKTTLSLFFAAIIMIPVANYGRFKMWVQHSKKRSLRFKLALSLKFSRGRQCEEKKPHWDGWRELGKWI